MARGGRASGSGGGSATVHFAHPNVDTSLKLQGLSVRELCALLEQGQGDVREVQLVEAYGLLVNATRVQVVGGAQASRLVLRDDDPQYRRFECTVTFFGNLPDEISRGTTARVIGNANHKGGFLAFNVVKCSGPLERSYARGAERMQPYEEA